MRLWERIHKDFWRFGFSKRICKRRGFARLWERIHDNFGRGFARICKTLGEDSQGFVRLWERIHKDS